MSAQEGCFGTCIMDGRFKAIEENHANQLEKYHEDRLASAVQMTEMKKDIKSILSIQSTMNDNLNKVLEENQKREVEQASSNNEASASKWKNLSTSARALIVTIIGSTIVFIITYALKVIIESK